jgi:hypothetical protein
MVKWSNTSPFLHLLKSRALGWAADKGVREEVASCKDAERKKLGS